MIVITRKLVPMWGWILGKKGVKNLENLFKNSKKYMLNLLYSNEFYEMYLLKQHFNDLQKLYTYSQQNMYIYIYSYYKKQKTKITI